MTTFHRNTENLFVDMHVHTNYSDGSFTPAEVVGYASEMKLAAISITDHDSIDGIDEALKEAVDADLEVVPGVELSSQLPELENSEMHILGYYIDHKNEELQNALDVFKKSRIKRAYKMLDKLSNNGIKLKDISFIENAGNKAVGRLHFAKALVQEKIVSNIPEAFQRFLANDKDAYVPKHLLTATDAIKLVLRAGGIPVMAHPYYVHYSDKEMFAKLVKDGLMGIEAWHIKHPPTAVRKFLEIADEFNLIVTGGSDCHGPYKKEPAIMGRIKVPYSVVENLKKAKIEKKK